MSTKSETHASAHLVGTSSNPSSRGAFVNTGEYGHHGLLASVHATAASPAAGSRPTQVRYPSSSGGGFSETAESLTIAFGVLQIVQYMLVSVTRIIRGQYDHVRGRVPEYSCTASPS